MMNKINKGQVSQYQQSYCFKICYQNFIIATCGCASLKYAFLNLTTPDRTCHSTKDIHCTDVADKKFYNTNNVLECYDACPIECKSVSYTFQTRMASYPTEWYAEQMNKFKFKFFNLTDTFFTYTNDPNPELTFEFIQNTTAMVNIFYDSMQFTTITESPMLPFEVLLANIGGNLGTF